MSSGTILNIALDRHEFRGTVYTAVEPMSLGSAIAIDISVQKADGVGVTAVNLGLPEFEIALGFSEGADAEFAHRFADKVLKRLGERLTPVEFVSVMEFGVPFADVETAPKLNGFASIYGSGL